MRIPHAKFILLMIFILVFLSFFSCAKDSDLLSDAILETSKVSSVEERNATEAEELLVDNTNSDWVTKTFAFSPISDAYVQEEEGYDQSIVRLQEDYRTSYLKFDLSPIEGNIVTAVLQFTIDSDDGDGTIMVAKGISNDWEEEDIAVNNAPSLDVTLGSINKEYKVGVTEKITLNASELVPEVTTIVLSHTAGNDLAFASKEHPDNIGPKMVVTYQVPPGTPDIQPIAEEIIENEPAETPPTNPTPPAEETPPPAEEGNGGQGSMNQYPEPDYFVTVNGKASNNGRSEASAWSIDHAFSNAVAGDVVYIKAGNYGNKKLVADNSGTADKPIKFIGYTNAPGDLVSNSGSTFNYGDVLDPNKMPMLVGSNPNGEGQETFLVMPENNVHLENIQITKYKSGIQARGNGVVLKNIIISQMGDYNPAHTYPTATSNKSLNYSGTGIVMSGNGSQLHNSFVINCGAQGVTFNNANGILAKNNSVYADNTVNPTDYYFMIAAETTNSTFINTKVVRVGSLEHHGHGIVVKGNGTISGNTVDGFEILNTFLEVQFPNTSNNVFKNGTVTKQQHVNNGTNTVGGLKVANGSHHNQFENIVLTNCSILFQDWNDGLAGDVNDASDNNIFDNVTVRDGHAGISFNFYGNDKHTSSADNNTFQNCTFENLNYLFERDRANSGTKLINCSINSVNQFAVETQPGGASYSVNATYQNCSWTNIGFNPPG